MKVELLMLIKMEVLIMAMIVVIEPGAAGWNVNVNQNFQALNNELTSLVSDTGWLSDGITLLNGTVVKDTQPNNVPMYRLVKIKVGNSDVKLLSVRAGIKGCTPGSQIINLPSIVRSANVQGAAFGDDTYRATLWYGYPSPVIYFDHYMGGSTQTVGDEGLTIEATFMY